jgi:dipeptidyl-peptidase-4
MTARGAGRKVAALFAACAAVATANAAESPAEWPRLDTAFLRDLTLTRDFTAGRPTHAQFTPDGRAVLFLRSGPRSAVLGLYELDVTDGRTRAVLTPEQILKGADEKLPAEEKARRERLRTSASGIAAFVVSPDGARILLTLSGRLYLLSRRDGAVAELPCGKGTLLDPRFSPDGRSVSYVLDHDVYVMDLRTLKERPITTGGTADVTHGLAEFVAQEEMERYAGYWWSPDSSTIAYEEADARDVEESRVADPAEPGVEPHAERYPRPGRSNVAVRLGLVRVMEDARARETVWVDWDRERFPYLATVRWGSAGMLSLLVQTRNQREQRLLAADLATGRTRALLTETDPAWLDIDQDVPYWLPDGTFLWVSAPAGGPQLELRDATGGLVRVLAKAEFGYVGNSMRRGSGLRVDTKGRVVYFRGGEDPSQVQLFRVPLAGGKPVRLTAETGVHAAAWGPGFTHFLRRSSGPRDMTRTFVCSADGRTVAELPPVAETPPAVPRTEYVKIPVELPATSLVPALRTTVRAAITRPRSFDAKRRYPVIVEAYGGPGVTLVQQSMADVMVWRPLLAQWRADQGFIVVSLDGRGTPGRGRAWERAIEGRFDEVPLADQIAGLQALGARYPELDLTRVGITGWSFGGYLAALAVMRRPDVFKAAAAGAPATVWEDYDTHYTERYLGTPQENPKGYEYSSLVAHASELRRPLLLIHGTLDDNVFFAHTLKLFDALFRAGGQDVELLPLHGSTHMVVDPSVRQQLEERIVRFFQKNL